MGRRRSIIIGRGAAGSAAAQALQQPASDVDATVTVTGAKNFPPDNRTTLNKGLLSAATDQGGTLLPGMELPGYERVITLRTISDTNRLRTSTIASSSGHSLFVGTGLIVTETASMLASTGLEVTVSGGSPLPLQQHLGRTVAQWRAAAHRSAGVEHPAATTIAEPRTVADQLLALFDDGGSVIVDVIIAAVGGHPDHWLAERQRTAVVTVIAEASRACGEIGQPRRGT